jgi:hypothetical protein
MLRSSEMYSMLGIYLIFARSCAPVARLGMRATGLQHLGGGDKTTKTAAFL